MSNKSINSSLEDLLAILTGPESNEKVIKELASLGLNGLSSLSKEELLLFEGINEPIAELIQLCLSLANGILLKKTIILH